METLPFTSFRHPLQIEPDDMVQKSAEYLEFMRSRRTVRQFSDREVPRKVIENCLLTAGSAPNGANKQPWFFGVVESQEKRKCIREAVEKEEHLFYNKRASKSWLNDLRPFGTNSSKPYLEIAPYLIAIFYKTFERCEDAQKSRCYYPKESTGIATGMLITALHNCGLATLTHTPSPMGFLNECLDIPTDQYKPFLLLVTGYACEEAKVPEITKKPLSEISRFY